jgi:fructose-bisphosphate aldolase class II
MISSAKDILNKAFRGQYAVGAFNSSNMEVTQGIVEAASELNSPIIIQTTPSAIEYAGLEELYQIIRTELTQAKVQGIIHLDHAKNFEMVRKAIEIGYNSVMIDASTLEFEENIHLTERVVSLAHSRGVAVEAELGKIGKGEEGQNLGKSSNTDPFEAAEFVKRTGVDSLAVSVGNVHGAPDNELINFHILKEIHKKVKIPLVLHGSSGLHPAEIKAAIKLGVSKINIDTNIRKTVLRAMTEELKDKPDDYRLVLSEVRTDVKKLVKNYIKIVGSADKN